MNNYTRTNRMSQEEQTTRVLVHALKERRYIEFLEYNEPNHKENLHESGNKKTVHELRHRRPCISQVTAGACILLGHKKTRLEQGYNNYA